MLGKSCDKNAIVALPAACKHRIWEPELAYTSSALVYTSVFFAAAGLGQEEMQVSWLTLWEVLIMDSDVTVIHVAHVSCSSGTDSSTTFRL